MPTDYVYAVGASLTGRVVAAGGRDGVVRIWDEKGRPLGTFEPRPPKKVAATKSGL